MPAVAPIVEIVPLLFRPTKAPALMLPLAVNVCSPPPDAATNDKSVPSDVRTVPAAPFAKADDTPELLPTSIEPRVRARVTVPVAVIAPPAATSPVAVKLRIAVTSLLASAVRTLLASVVPLAEALSLRFNSAIDASMPDIIPEDLEPIYPAIR